MQRGWDVFCHQFCGFVRGEPDLRGGGVFGGSACVPDNCVECQREGSTDGWVDGGTDLKMREGRSSRH